MSKRPQKRGEGLTPAISHFDYLFVHEYEAHRNRDDWNRLNKTQT